MKKHIWLGILVASLFGVSAAFAQVTDFQKQMMEQMQKKMMGGGAGAGAGAAGMQQPSTPASTTPMEVTQGKAIFNDSSLGTNGKSCGSCHVEGKKPLDGRKIDNRLVAFVQYCYEHAIGGQKVIETGKLDKLIAYFGSLGGEKPGGAMFQGNVPSQGGQVPMQQQSPMMQQGEQEDDAW